MKKELASKYDHKSVEKGKYQHWLEKEYFKAGDVSITSSIDGNAVKNAKALLDDACASISHLVADKSFYFREV